MPETFILSLCKAGFLKLYVVRGKGRKGKRMKKERKRGKENGEKKGKKKGKRK